MQEFLSEPNKTLNPTAHSLARLGSRAAQRPAVGLAKRWATSESIILKRWALVTLLSLATSLARASACYESSVVSPTPFLGNDGEIVKLTDGSLWEVKFEYEYLYEYYPSVIICPEKGKLGINGKMLNVQPIGASKALDGEKNPEKTSGIIESRIDGDFEGWEGDTIFKLVNGQIWQQIDGRFKFKYTYSPKVLIFRDGTGYQMQVDGVDERIRVERLK